jgi:hypothetical protein
MMQQGTETRGVSVLLNTLWKKKVERQQEGRWGRGGAWRVIIKQVCVERDGLLIGYQQKTLRGGK